jgi:hypothetical protein
MQSILETFSEILMYLKGLFLNILLSLGLLGLALLIYSVHHESLLFLHVVVFFDTLNI